MSWAADQLARARRRAHEELPEGEARRALDEGLDLLLPLGDLLERAGERKLRRLATDLALGEDPSRKLIAPTRGHEILAQLRGINAEDLAELEEEEELRELLEAAGRVGLKVLQAALLFLLSA